MVKEESWYYPGHCRKTMYDLLIKDALIIDGSGAPFFVGSAAHKESNFILQLIAC